MLIIGQARLSATSSSSSDSDTSSSSLSSSSSDSSDSETGNFFKLTLFYYLFLQNSKLCLNTVYQLLFKKYIYLS